MGKQKIGEMAMNISFATCEPKRALEFIRTVYSERTVTEEQCKEVLDLVAQDIIRIQDPMMHGSAIQIEVGKKYKVLYVSIDFETWSGVFEIMLENNKTKRMKRQTQGYNWRIVDCA